MAFQALVLVALNKEVKNFPTVADDLINLPIYKWGKLLFTSLGTELPSELFFREMAERINWMPIDEFVFHPELSKDYLIDAHWALYCENFLEGFHIPFVHAGCSPAPHGADHARHRAKLNEPAIQPREPDGQRFAASQ